MATPPSPRAGRAAAVAAAGAGDGGGLDILALASAGMVIDLSAIAGPGAIKPAGLSRPISIETMNRAGSGDQSLSLVARDVIDLARMAVFGSDGGWSSIKR